MTRHWFLIGLALALSEGMRFAPYLAPIAARRDWRWGVVAGVIFLMAWTLNTAQLVHAIRRPWGAVLATAINLAGVPLAAWPMMPLFPADLGFGLLVAAATPCTLASAAVWTRRAAGREATALLVTVVSNLAAIGTLPLWVSVAGGHLAESSAVHRLFLGLVLLVLVPLAVGQMCRAPRVFRALADRRRWVWSGLAQLGILWTALCGAAQTERWLVEAGLPGLWLGFAVLACVILLHAGALAFGLATSHWVGLDRGDKIAVGMAGSQKTLMVGLAVCLELGASIFPIVVYHAAQLFVDTWVAQRWAAGSTRAAGPRPHAAAAAK